jgi:hypothetical protein
MGYLQNAMTVGQLRKELEGLPDDAVVLYVCDYGDHCHTQQALPISEIADLGCDERIEESAYSSSGLCLLTINDEDEDDDEDSEKETEEEETEDRNYIILR